jgi:glycine/D-amino acid oxidase-like deaminating enzyme
LSEVPVYPPHDPAFYDAVVLRGLSKMIPELAEYFSPADPLGSTTQMKIKSGYYCKTVDNTPLLGSLDEVDGLYVCG